MACRFDETWHADMRLLCCAALRGQHKSDRVGSGEQHGREWEPFVAHQKRQCQGLTRPCSWKALVERFLKTAQESLN